MIIRSTRVALAFAALLSGLAQAQVAPPALPPGSELVRPQPGMSEPEAKRAMRAHHHKMHHGKDVTRDDSVLGPETESVRPVVIRPAAASATGAGAGAGVRASGAAGATVQGGAGTGPAREKTDKGASSYFFGTDNKK
jgi:hypothetical protein